MIKRIEKLRSRMKKKDIESLLVESRPNMFYLSNFSGTTGKLLFTPDNNYFYTDGRYIEQAKNQVNGYEIVEVDNDYLEKFADVLKKEKIKKLYFAGEEISYNRYQKFEKKFTDIELVSVENIIEDLRVIKDNSEINKIKQAINITDRAFLNILDYIKPGLTEKDIALELEYYMKKNGGDKIPFTFIVASGERSSLPHGVAGEKVVKKGDFITMDFGIVYQGYCSDITRTVFLGKPNSKQEKIYDLVLKAQKEVINQIKSGMTGKEVDAIARNIFKDAGYGEYFKHGLGHGIGIEVHEQPRVSYKNEDKLKPGMVLTDEPGIYIPDWGGVRIEDDLLITKKGCEVLNNSPKELIVL